MLALTRRLSAALALVATPALGVGLGPLLRTGVTDGPGKAFFLEVSNPYARVETFELSPLAMDSELPAGRVRVVPAQVLLAPGGRRRVIVIARPLLPGETYTFRVCAERPVRPEETFHARVCSKLAARRLAYRG